MKFEVRVGFVEIEYGVKMVGDCMIENGDETLGEMLIVGMTRTGREPPEAAAAAAAPALRFLLPADAAEAAAELPPPPPKIPKAEPVTGPAAMRCVLNRFAKADGAATADAIDVSDEVALVNTGFEKRGTCETAISGPDIPVTSVELPLVSTP